MSDQGFKISCEVRPLVDGKPTATYKGLAHIIEGQYDEHFTVWYGAVEVTCSMEALHEIHKTQRVVLHLEDGRTGEVKVMGGTASNAVNIPGLTRGTEVRHFYFVGTCKL